MTRHVLFAAAFTLVCAASPVAHGQMAGAIGKPLPDANLSTGTVTVRVISGALDKPIVGVNAQLVTADGKVMTARTDSEGRATFANLNPGAQYVAKATEIGDETADGEDKKQGVSEPFTIPATGGVRLMLSTRPFGGGAGPAVGGAAMGPMGAMDPRQMSGITRGDPAVPAGSMTVAVVRDSVSNRLPDHTVHVIGFGADGSVTRETQKTDADGRATFTGLLPRTHAYYAITTFQRADGGIDRVLSDPISVPPRVGLRMLLAGSPTAETEPAIDDLAFVANQSERTRPGEILAQFWYRDESKVDPTVKLFEVGDNGALLSMGQTPMTPPQPADLRADFSAGMPMAEQAKGSLSIMVMDIGRQGVVMPGASVELEPVTQPLGATPDTTTTPGTTPDSATADAGQAADSGLPPMIRISNDQGIAEFQGLNPGQPYRVALSLFERRFYSDPVLLPEDRGVRMQVNVSMRFEASAEARFAASPDKVYVVETQYGNRLQRTRPFVTVADRGAVIGLPMYTRPAFSFHYVGWVDDEYMGFQGQLALLNLSSAPWDPGPNGLEIPLPKGFKGGRVDDEVTNMVKVVDGSGLVWRDLMPPGRASFRLGFSLNIVDGTTNFDLPMPHGAFKGSVILIKNPGMRVLDTVPAGLFPTEREARDGRTIFEFNDLNFEADKGESLAFRITGLPGPPETEKYIQMGIGALVTLLMGWALFQLFATRRRENVAVGSSSEQESERARLRKLKKRREELLEKLVELESQKRHKEIAGEAYKRERQKLQSKLEAVYADIEALEAPLGSAAA